jgi:alpha-D-ribose 1-methylphosphonate 5-triphosphate synthase subunit PhnG
LQNEACFKELEVSLITPIRLQIDQENRQKNERTQTTKVNFFTVARENTGSLAEDE